MEICAIKDHNQWIDVLKPFVFDFYHLPAYVLGPPKTPSKAVCYHISDNNGCEMLIPFVYAPADSRMPDMGRDYQTPYGYGGPIVHGDAGITPSDDFVDTAFLALVEELKSVNATSIFIRMHPILSPQYNPSTRVGELVFHGRTVAIDLQLPQAEIQSNIRTSNRQEIKKLIQKNVRFTIEDNLENLILFVDAYINTMKRVKANKSYFFDMDYFKWIHGIASGGFLLAIVWHSSGELMCGGIFSEINGLVQYHLGATMSKYVNDHPSKLMLSEVALWAKTRGNKFFHLGGGVGGSEDSLFQYKLGFSKKTFPFHTLRIIANQTAYTKLSERFIRENSNLATSFFPIYKQPLI